MDYNEKNLNIHYDKNMKIFQIQSSLVRYMREYLYNNDFTENHLLIVMSNGGNSKTVSKPSIPEETFDPKDDAMNPADPEAMEEITTGKKKK